MTIEEMKVQRLSSLEKAYEQQMKALNKELDVEEVDPEKMNTALKAYKTAAEESDYVLDKIISLKLEQGLLFEVEDVGAKKKQLSPESRISK